MTTIEDLEELEIEPQPSDDHLSYPAPSAPATFERPEPVEQPKRLHVDRLYIGNLHPSVDEYALLHVFSKFGRVTKLDYLFHKSGPLKGKPRGYAFIEYGREEEAQKALSMAHDKLLRGRKIVVTYAQQAPLDQYGNSMTSKYRKGATEIGRPTAISIIKTGLNNRQEPKTAHKIALMEAKLRELEADKPSSESHSSSLPHHPSLPLKPPPQSAAAIASSSTAGPQHRKPSKPSAPLPSLPMLPPKSTSAESSGYLQPKGVRELKSKLAGVVIKPKVKPKQ